MRLNLRHSLKAQLLSFFLLLGGVLLLSIYHVSQVLKHDSVLGLIDGRLHQERLMQERFSSLVIALEESHIALLHLSSEFLSTKERKNGIGRLHQLDEEIRIRFDVMLSQLQEHDPNLYTTLSRVTKIYDEAAYVRGNTVLTLIRTGRHQAAREIALQVNGPLFKQMMQLTSNAAQEIETRANDSYFSGIHAVEQFVNRIWLVLGIIGALILMGGMFFYRAIIKSIEKLISAIEIYHEERYSFRLPELPSVELNQVGQALNDYAQQLHEKKALLARAEHELHERNRQLEALALEDKLTGIANRHAFENKAPSILERASREQKTCCLIYLDLNNFKEINDQYGHQTGDQVLRAFTRKIAPLIRQHELFVRLGGDEFIILTDVIDTPEQAQPLVKRLEQAFDSQFQVSEKLRVNLQASIGSANYRQGMSLEELMHEADRKMYQIKKALKE